jgi:DNA-binding XRE family transcriptional regulator
LPLAFKLSRLFDLPIEKIFDDGHATAEQLEKRYD